MKNTFKKLLSLLLVAMLLISAVPAYTLPTFAEGIGNEAKIGDTEYPTLAAAIKEVKTAEPTTITLLKDTTVSSTMVGHSWVQNITIDLNGHTLSSNSITLTAYRSGTTLTVTNGTVSGNSTSGSLRATYGGKLILGDNLTVKAGGSATLVYVDKGGALEITAANGVRFEGGKYGIRLFDNENTKVVGATAGNAYYATLAQALEKAQAGDTVTMLSDVETSTIVTIDKAIILDGNGNTLTSSAGRAINVSTEGKVTIKNLNIDCSGERAINVIQKPATLTIDNVTAKASHYTVNVASSANAAKVNIINSTLDGLNVVNVSGKGANITVSDSTINCNDNNTTEGEVYAALCLNKEAIGGKITATDCTINVTEGSDSEKARNGAEGGTVIIDNSDDEVSVTVAVITYPNSDNYHGFCSLADAIAFAKAGDTITLIRDIKVSEIIVIDKAITLDGNGKTLTSSAGRAINVSTEGDVTIKNLTIDCSGERAINVIQKPATLTIDNVTATASNYTVNVASSAGAAQVAIINSTLNGLNVVNIAGAGANITVSGSIINCNDNNTTEGEGYAALCLNKDAIGGKITATGCTINVTKGSDSQKARNGAEGGTITIDGSDDEVSVTVAIITYPDNYAYHGFRSLAEAIAFAKAGDTITLIRDIKVSEIIVINKAITLNGNGKTLTSTAGRAINVSGADGVTIKDLTINCSGEHAINIIQNATNVTIDHVTATAANYVVNVASSAGAAKVTIINSSLTGLNVVNVAGAGAIVNVSNSTLICNDQSALENYSALVLNADATNGQIIAENVLFTIHGDSYKAINSAVGGKITIDGMTNEVITPVAYISYGINSYTFNSLADAIEYAKNGETIVLMKDINLTAENFGEKHEGYNTFFNISGKTITIDLNGYTIKADVSEAELDAFIIGVFCTTNNGHLTLEDSSEGKTGSVIGYSGTQAQAFLDPNKGNTDYNYKFYSLLVNYNDDCSIIINGGNYSIDYAGDSLGYTSCNEGLIVNGGTFKLGNLGGIRNGMPWIFNARGRNIRHVVVNGGSFCTDIQHQYYPFEVYVPRELALQKGKDGMYTIVDAVAYVTEREWSSAWYTNEVGYATLEEAIEACEGPQTKKYGSKFITSEQEVIVLLQDINLAENKTIVIGKGKSVSINLNGKTIYGENTRTNTHNFLIDVNEGILTAYNGTIAMKHTGANMGWNGATTVIDVTAGGVLNLSGVTVKNLGGTDMNFAVHLNNWGEVTLNADDCTFDAPYCGVRVFNSGFDMNNVKITNSTLTGNTRAFWVHNYLGDLDSSKHSDEAIKARLNLDIYGNNNTFEITGTAKAPIRYGFGETVYFNADGAQVVDSAEGLQDAVNNGSGNIVLGGDVDLNDLLKP